MSEFSIKNFQDSLRPKGQQPDPKKELQDYMKKHNCSEAEAKAALRKLHGGNQPQKPHGNTSKNFNMSPQQMEKNVRAYATEHNCSMQEAAKALGYPPPQRR